MNSAVKKLFRGRETVLEWRGDIDVVQISTKTDRFINLVSKRGQQVAKFAVKKYVTEIKRRKRFWVPKKMLVFKKS